MAIMRSTLVGLALIVGCSLCSDALAQQGSARRSVSRPAISPLLNQYRTEIGLRENLNLFSRPSATTGASTRQPLTTTYGSSLNSTLPRSPEVTRNRDRILQQKAERLIAPTGVNASYMNMGHFYPVTPRGKR
jgi:hypothetical protein